MGPPLRPDRQRLLETLFANWFELGAEFLFICFALVVVMALAGRVPAPLVARRRARSSSGSRSSSSFIYPYLTPTEPLRRADLQAAGREYAAKQGIDPVPLRVEDVTDFTSAPNAYAVGFGPSKRIVFWNTLLDGSFTDDEVKTVLAHEIGHHSSNHLFEGRRLVRALRAARRLADRARRRAAAAAWRNPAAVPLSLLVIVVLDLLSLPVYNVISRHMEAEADWKALETTHNPEPAKSLFSEFTIQSLNDPDPPTWSYLLFDSHPSVEQRIAMAEAWRSPPLGQRVLRAGAALGRGQPAALGGDRAALDAVGRVHLDVDEPVARVAAELVHLRRAHVHPGLGEVPRDVCAGSGCGWAGRRASGCRRGRRRRACRR